MPISEVANEKASATNCLGEATAFATKLKLSEANGLGESGESRLDKKETDGESRAIGACPKARLKALNAMLGESNFLATEMACAISAIETVANVLPTERPNAPKVARTDENESYRT